MNRFTTLVAGSMMVGAMALSAGAQTPSVVDRGLLPGDLIVGPAVNSQQDHSAARGGDQFLIAWSDYRARSVGGSAVQSDGDIFGIRIDASGAPIDSVPFLIAGGMGVQDKPMVAWNGENWLVAYTSQDPVAGYFENRLRAVRVSPAGQVLDATPLSFPDAQFGTSTIGLQIAGQSGQWLVTRCVYHGDGYGTFLAGQRLNSAGQLLDPSPLMLQDWVYGQTKTLIANGEYVVIGPDWTTSSTIKARRVNLSGQPVGGMFTLPSMNVATNGSEFYVTWIKDFVDLVGSRVTAAGTLLNPAGTLIVPSFSQYNEQSLTHDGTNWWLEWGAADQLHTVRINSAGTVLDAGGGPLLPIVIGGTVNNAYKPMLLGRTGGGAHLFWYDARAALGSDANVFVLPITSANQPETQRCVSTSTPNHRLPDFAAGPNGQVALTFVSELANDRRVMVRFLSASGEPNAGGPIEVFRGPTVGQSTIAWNGSVYMVAWDSGPSGLTPISIKMRRMNADGSFVDASPIDVMPGYSPDVEALGDDFLIASSRVHTFPQTIFAQAIRVDGPTGALLDPSPFILLAGYVSTGPRVKTDGTRWVVTYHSHWSHDSSQSDAVYNFVNANGTFTPALNPTTTSGGAGTPDVAWSGSKFLFVWRSNTLSNANNYISGRVMNADGSFATGDFVIAEAPGRQLRPVVSWDGTSFVVAWDDQRNQGSFFDARTDIYAARVSESGVVLDPSAFPVVATAQGDASAAIFSKPNGATYFAGTRFITSGGVDSYRVGVSVIVPACPMDLNRDGTVGLADIADVITHWGEATPPAPASFDLDGSGDIGLGDIAVVITAWGDVCP